MQVRLHFKPSFARACICGLARTCLCVLATTLAACGVIRTTADVAQAGVSVVGTTVSATATVAKTTADIGIKTASTAATIGSAAVSAGSATMSAGSAAVSAGAAAKGATAATYSVAVAGATAVGGAVKWGMEFSRADDLEFTQVKAEGANSFVSKEGTSIATNGCDEMVANTPALLVVNRKGEYNVRTRVNDDARNCSVVSIVEQKP
jgi:hypothetical protein